MLKQNKRLVAFTVAVVMILIVSSILPASAQLSQWRSLNPTRDGALLQPFGLHLILSCTVCKCSHQAMVGL